MNILNKNVCRTMSIFLLLTLLYVGLCSEAAAFPPDVMAVGELHELEGGYSIAVVEADVESGEAGLVLYKEGREVDNTGVSSGAWFYLDDGDQFYFEATLDSIFRDGDTITVKLTDYDWWIPPPPGVMSVGESHGLDEEYSIEVAEANLEEEKAQFVLYKGGKGIDVRTVSRGEFFILSDGEIFYFSATLDSVFSSDHTIKVHLSDIDYYYYSPAGDYLIPALIALIALILSILSFFYYKRHKKKLLEKESKLELEKKSRFEQEEKLAQLDAESHSMRDRVNNLEIELKRITEFVDMQPRENPYVAGGAVDDTRFWIGNENLINRVLTSIRGNHFFIRGERRAGKTTLLRRISKALEMRMDPETRFIPVYVSLQGIPPQTFFKNLYNAIVSKVDINPSELEEIVDAEDFINAMSYIIESLNNSSSTKSIIALLLDEFELFNSYPLDLRESFRTVFMGPPEFSERIRLIATGTELTVWTRSSPMNYLIELEIEPLTAKEAREMILMPARGVVSFDEAAVDRIIEVTKGRPFEIQKICEQLINNAIQKHVYRIKVEDAEELRDLIIPKLREASK